MKKSIITFSLLALGFLCRAQTAEDSVKAVINNFFAGMKNSDTVLIRSALSDNAIFQTISVSKDGKAKVITDKVDDFIRLVDKLEKNSADERIKFGSILIDGILSHVWTPYEFYYKEKFSHCGVNSFQLVRLAEGWKIQYVIDTRKKNDCN